MAKTRARFIARNDLPGLIKQRVTAGSEGDLGCELISVSSAPLCTHLNKGEAPERMQSQRFDDMGLQEQSTLPIKNSTCCLENVHDFDALIRKAGVCTVLYMTWVRRNAPQTQDALSTVCIHKNKATGAIVVLAGLAWQRCLQEYPDILLHDKDPSYSNLVGSDLAACPFYAALFPGHPCSPLYTRHYHRPARPRDLRRPHCHTGDNARLQIRTTLI